MAHESAYFDLDKIDGKHSVKALKKGLDALPGVMSVSVNERSGSMAVDYDSTGVTQKQLQNKIHELGYLISSLNIDQLTD